MKTLPISILFCILFFLLSLMAPVSVTAYPILPLPGAKEFKPEKPFVDKVHIRVKISRRPALKAIKFDDRNGLNFMETALLAVVMNSKLRFLRDSKGRLPPQLIKGGIVPGFKLTYSLKNAPGGGSAAKREEGAGLGSSIMGLVAESAQSASHAAAGGIIELDTAWQEWQIFIAARLYFSLHNTARRRVDALRRLMNLYKRLFLEIKKSGRGKQRHKELSKARAAFKGVREELDAAKKQLEMFRVNLSHITGIPPSLILSLNEDVSARLPKRLPSLKAIVKGLDTLRLDLMALKTGAKNKNAVFQGAILSRFPKIDITVPKDLMLYDRLISAAGVNMRFPIFDTDYGWLKVNASSGRELLEVHDERFGETKEIIPVIIAHLKRTAADITSVDKSLKGLKRKAGRLEKPSMGNGKNLIKYYRASEKILLTELLRIKYERRLVELEAELEAGSGRILPSPSR